MYLGIADCHRLKGDYQIALDNYTLVGANQPTLLKEVSVKKAICLIELGNTEKALSELDIVEITEPGVAR